MGKYSKAKYQSRSSSLIKWTPIKSPAGRGAKGLERELPQENDSFLDLDKRRAFPSLSAADTVYMNQSKARLSSLAALACHFFLTYIVVAARKSLRTSK